MNSDHDQTIESNIPRRGRPRKKSIALSPKSKSSPSGVRKLKPRAVKLVLPSVQAAVQNLKNVANKSSEIVKTFPITTAAKDTTPITTFLLTPSDGKTGKLASASKSGSVPLTLMQQVSTSGQASIKQMPVAVSSNILSSPRIQVPTSTGSAPKLLIITTTSNSAAGVTTTSTNQTLCKTFMPVKLGSNISNSGPVVAANLSKQVLYQIPSSQSSGMVLLSTTAPSQSGGAPKKYLLIPSSTTTKRQANATVVLNSKISHSVDSNSDKPIIAITSPAQTACISTPDDSSKPTTTILPISNLSETVSKKLTRLSAVKGSSPTKPVNTSRRRGSVLGANSTISSIPSGIFKTVACTTNSRGICSTPVGVQTSKKQSKVKLTQVGGLPPHGTLITAPVQQTSTFSQDASVNMTIPTVPQASLKTNHLTSSPRCRASPANLSKPSQTLKSDSKLNASSESMNAGKRTPAVPGRRARKSIPRIDNSRAAGSTSFITVPSSLPFSAIQLKPNCSTSFPLSASSFSNLSWVVPSPNTGGHQQKSNTENGTRTKSPSLSAKYKNMPKLIVVNGVSNGSLPTTMSACSQTSNTDGKTVLASQYSQSSPNPWPIYASPPKLTIAPGFSPSDKKGSESGKKTRPSELMIIKEREEFIDDSGEKSNLEDLSPPKLQREDEPDSNVPFNFEMPQSFSPAYLPLARSTPASQTKSNSELYPKSPHLLLSSMTNKYQSFCQDLKPMVRKDNFPTLASLSAMNSEFITRLDKNRKLSFGQLFNHFKHLADKKKNKKASSHSAIMFQVAHSIHCCVVLTSMDIEDSVDVNNLPFSVEESMKCSVNCRRTFMEEVFANKGQSPHLDPRFSLSLFKSSDSASERSLQYHHSRGPTNSSSSINDIDSLSSTVTSALLNIKTELSDYYEYPQDPQQQISKGSAPLPRKSTSGLTSEASTQKFATETDESFSSLNSPSTNCDCKGSMKCIQNPCSDCSKPKGSLTSTKRLFHCAAPKESSTSTCFNSCARGKKRGKSCFSNRKSKKANSSSLCSSEQSAPCKIKNECNDDTGELSSVSNVSSPPSFLQRVKLAGKLRYKILPKDRISLSGKSDPSEKVSNCTDNPEKQTRVPVQSPIISDDKKSINPLQTISPILAQTTIQHKDGTNNVTESQLVGKRKRKQPQNDPGKKLPTKKIRLSKTKQTLPSKGSSLTKSPKESCLKSPASAKIPLPFPESPASLRDRKHLNDEPTTADRVVMLTPDGKPILKDVDLQITFDESVGCLTSPKKKRKYSKGKSSELKSPSSSKNLSPSSQAKDKGKGTHSKSSSRPPRLGFLLREIEQKSKNKYLLYPKNNLGSQKSKKTNIEEITNNIATGFPAYGPGSPRSTMKLYKYFVSMRIKNRAKKNGSHEIDAPLTLYINWKTIARQPFKKHRITNHTPNIMAIKKAKQLSNFKKCKGRSRMCKPVKNRPLFMKRRKALNGKLKTNSSNKSKKKTNMKHSKLLQQSWSRKKKPQITKTSTPKKKTRTPVLSCNSKTEDKMVKTEKSLSCPDLSPVAHRANSKTLVNKNATKKKPLKKKRVKSAPKKLINLPLIKKEKQVKEERATKKGLSRCSSLPVLRTTRSRVALPETTSADLKKVDSLCETSSQIKTEPINTEINAVDTKSTKLNQQEILNEQADSNEPVHLKKDEDSPSKSKCKVAGLKADVEESLANTKPDIPNNQPDLKENDSYSSPCEILDTPIQPDSTDVETAAILENQSHQGQRKQNSKVLTPPANTPRQSVSEEDPNIKTPTQALSKVFESHPADENAEVVTEPQLTSPDISEDPGNFIFDDDDIEPLSPNMDNTPNFCKQNKQSNSMHCSSDVEENQSVISNTNSNSSFTNITPSIRSSAFSDKFDIGLSPELARIQRLKDQLQEKQKALDLAKLYLK